MVGISKDHVDSSNWDGQCQRLACPAVRHHRQEDWLHPCVDTQQDVLYPIQCQTTNGVGRLGKAICEVLPQVSLLYVLWRHLRRGFVVDPFVLTVKLFSALHSSYMHLNQHSTTSWIGLLCIKRTYVSRRVRTMLFFAVFLVLEFIDWIICRSQQRLTAGLTNSVRCKSVQGVRT